MSFYFAFLSCSCLLNWLCIVSGQATRISSRIQGCDVALGMQNGWIEDMDVTASSFLSHDHDPGRARLNSTSAWVPARHDASELLQIHFVREANISSIAVQGHPDIDRWVTKYRLDYSMDGINWNTYQKILEGSTDRKSVVRSSLDVILTVHYLRVKPVEWHGAIALRLEVYGCMKDVRPCGKRPLFKTTPQARIIRGTTAAPYTWPWQVDVTINNTEHWCGASIIDPHWIITAGHCVDIYSPEAVGERVLRLAEHDRMILEGYEKYVVPDRIYLHPGFVIGGEFTPGYYDVALMHLKDRLVFSDRIQPVCLPSEDDEWFEAGKMCYISGWGKTSAGPNGTYAKVLQQLQVPLVSKEVCNSNISYNGTIPQRFFCAGYAAGGRDACFGDSGGPFVCQNEAGDWILRGLVSWGEGCALPNKYGVYTDVQRMLPFIESVMYGYPKCGVRFLPEGTGAQSRIVGGREARANSWPWQVDILTTVSKTEHYCGGSLLNPSWVLTSAHCFYKYKNISNFEIRMGEHDERKFEGYEEIIAGESYHVHPGFVLGNAQHPGHFDVALIKLKRPAVFYKRVLSVCLPEVSSNLTTGTSCYVTGWGKTAENNTHYPPVLNELQVDLVSKEVCNSNASYNGTIPEEYICAGFSGGGRDSCSGDSGGPLVCANEEGRYVLRGVVSWGIGCARPDKYGVYLDVRRILPFIEGMIEGVPKCGVRFLPEGTGAQSRIVGGREARANSWPWQVDILTTVSKTEHYCGGSLLNPSWVLTSAHCFYQYKNISNFEIRIGEHDERKFEGYEEIIPGESYHVHPGFVLGNAQYPGHFDVALIKLKRPAVFYKRVLSVCLPEVSSNLTTGTSCYVTGWGKTAENNTHYPPVLNELQVDLVSKEVCNSNASYNGTIPDEYFCAGFSGGGRDSCSGDSGGPLVCANEEGRYVLRGVVSWGVGCARPDKYGVYLDVRKVLPFINETIKRNT